MSSGAEADLQGVSVRRASTALSVSSGGLAVLRGEVRDSTVGLDAQGWVDARGVDWGGDGAPSPLGTGAPVQGDGAWYVPYKGWDPTAYSTGGAIPIPDPEPCADIEFIGVRGSGEDPQQDPPVYNGLGSGFGQRNVWIASGIQDYMEAERSDLTFRWRGLRYRALGVLHNPLNLGHPDYMTSIYQGVDQLVAEIKAHTASCRGQGQRMVLIGYSQGALAIHLALRELERTDPGLLARDNIAGIALLADPGKVPYDAEFTFEEPDKPAGTGVDKAAGIWTGLMENVPKIDKGPLPEEVVGRTYAICANHDPVCAPAKESSYLTGLRNIKHDMDVHTNYDQAELHWLGERVAQAVLPHLPPPPDQ